MTIVAIALFVSGVVLLAVLPFTRGVVKPYGRRRRRQLVGLRKRVAAAGAGGREMTVDWLDYSSLTKLDFADVLWEFGLAIRGQDHCVRGWPLHVGPARAEDRPPSREELLREQLRVAGRSGKTHYDLELMHFEDLGMQHVEKVVRSFGWRTGGVTVRPTPRVRLRRSPYG